MSGIVLEIELTEKNMIKMLGFFLMVMYKVFHFVHQRLLNLINRLNGTQDIYMELRGVEERSIIRSCLQFFTI